jgi:hypothetical protein
VTAYEQQDSCGVYHAVQYNNLCHMLTWVWRGSTCKIAMLIQRVCSVRLCCVSRASVTDWFVFSLWKKSSYPSLHALSAVEMQ